MLVIREFFGCRIINLPLRGWRVSSSSSSLVTLTKWISDAVLIDHLLPVLPNIVITRSPSLAHSFLQRRKRTTNQEIPIKMRKIFANSGDQLWWRNEGGGSRGVPGDGMARGAGFIRITMEGRNGEATNWYFTCNSGRRDFWRAFH